MICLCLYILFLVFKVSEGLTECHNTDCVTCDCFNQTLIPQTITCNEYQIIRLEFYLNRRIRYSHFLGDECNSIYNETLGCYHRNTQYNLLDFQQRLEIYHACNAKRSCDVTVPTEMPVKVEIPFVCEWETTLRRISSKIAQTAVEFPVFHFSGAEYKGNVVNCDCKIEMTEIVLFEMFFINLGQEACKRVIISNNDISLFRCTENGLQYLYGNAGNIEGQMQIQIVDLVAQGDEVLYFKLRGSNMRVQCSGCSVRKPGNTENLTETPPVSNTKTIVSSTEIPPLEESTDTSSVIWVTVLSINGAVIILICIANILYCYTRRKKLSKKPAKEDTQISEYEHYASVDGYSTTPHNTTNSTNTHQYLNLIDNGDYLVPLSQPEPHQTNGHSMVKSTTPVNGIHNGLAARISSEYGYNRAVTSKE